MDELQTSEQETQEQETTPETVVETATPQTEEVTPEASPEAEEVETPAQEPQPPQVDYQKKFKESAREAQIIAEKAKQAQARLQHLTSNNTPTEDELRQAYLNWDLMNDVEKDVYRRLFVSEKKNARLEHTVLDWLEQQQWEKDFSAVLKSNPALREKEEDFKTYCYKPTHKNVPLDVLVKSFLFEIKEDAPAPASRPTLQRGSGGPKPEVKTKLSAEDADLIRRTDPKKFRDLIMEGKIG